MQLTGERVENVFFNVFTSQRVVGIKITRV